MKVFILSAGLGTRLQPHTNDYPKVMVKVGGKPVLEHLVILCKKHQLTEIIINLHYLPESIVDYFGSGNKWGVNIKYSDEKARLLGGAGALKHAQRLLENDSFFVLNGDVMTNVDLTQMSKFHKQKKSLGTFLVHDTDHPYDSDVVNFDDENRITKFFRPKQGDQFKPISKTGTHLFEPEVLKYIPDNQEYSLEKQLIPELLAARKPLYAFHSNCYSKDMGTIERLEQVRSDFKAGKINS